MIVDAKTFPLLPLAIVISPSEVTHSARNGGATTATALDYGRGAKSSDVAVP